jgi:hypothetical protein
MGTAVILVIESVAVCWSYVSHFCGLVLVHARLRVRCLQIGHQKTNLATHRSQRVQRLNLS